MRSAQEGRTEETRRGLEGSRSFTALASAGIPRRIRAMKILLALLMLTTSMFADGPIRHVVHFKFKKDAEPAAVQKVVDEFAKLKGKIPAVESLEGGKNVSPEGMDKGFTHCWIASFKSEADRDVYLKHADHLAFVAILKPVLEDALVIDFIPAKSAK